MHLCRNKEHETRSWRDLHIQEKSDMYSTPNIKLTTVRVSVRKLEDRGVELTFVKKTDLKETEWERLY